MRVKVLLVTLLVAGISASVAVAAPPPAKGKRDEGALRSHGKNKGQAARVGATCRPRVSLVVKGFVVSIGSDSLVVDVRRANRHGRALVGKQVTISVVARTKIRRMGKAELSELEAKDRVKVQVRACKRADVAASLVAKHVVARPVPAPENGEERNDAAEGAASETEETAAS